MNPKEKLLPQIVEWEINGHCFDVNFVETSTESPLLRAKIGVNIIRAIENNVIQIDFEDIEMLFKEVIAFRIENIGIHQGFGEVFFDYDNYDVSFDYKGVNIGKVNKKWLETKVCTNPYFYVVENSKWVKKKQVSNLKHYLLTTNEYVLEVLSSKEPIWRYL